MVEIMEDFFDTAEIKNIAEVFEDRFGNFRNLYIF